MKLLKNAKWLGAIVLSASIGYGAAAVAQTGHPDGSKQEHRREHMQKLGEHMKKELSLTDQQVAQIKQIREQNKATFKSDRDAVKAAEKGSDAQKAAIAKMKSDRDAVQAQIKNILTQEQRQKLADLQAKRKANWEKRKQAHEDKKG